MKRKLSILLLAVTTLFFTACQKKQVAYFQKSQTENFAHAPKATQPVVANDEVTTTVSNPLADEVAVASSNESVASVVTETPKKAEMPVLKMDEKSIDAEFEQLNKVEEYVNANKGVTADEVKVADVAKDLKLDTNVTAAVAVDELPLGIPAFWWGCVLGVIGVILVYVLTDKDKEQTKKALIGALIWVAVWILWAVLWRASWWF
jgi:hypothetical protein